MSDFDLLKQGVSSDFEIFALYFILKNEPNSSFFIL